MANFKIVEGAEMNVDQIWNNHVKPELDKTYGSSGRITTSDDYPKVVSKFEGDLISAYSFVKIKLKQDGSNVKFLQKGIEIADRIIAGVNDLIKSFAKETWLQNVSKSLKEIEATVIAERDVMQQKLNSDTQNSKSSSSSFKP